MPPVPADRSARDVVLAGHSARDVVLGGHAALVTPRGPDLAALAHEARLLRGLHRRREQQCASLRAAADAEVEEAVEAEMALVFAAGRSEYAEDQLERFKQRAQDSVAALRLEKQELQVDLGQRHLKSRADGATTPPDQAPEAISDELEDVEQEVEELSGKWRLAQDREGRHLAEHRKLTDTADMALRHHQELRGELGERQAEIGRALAKLQALRALCVMSEGKPFGGPDGGVPSVLRSCEDTLLQAGGEAALELAAEHEALNPLRLMLPLLRKDGGAQAEQWMLPPVDGAARNDPEEEARLQHLVEDLADRNEALRQELRLERRGRAAREAEVGLQRAEVRLAQLQEETSELRLEVSGIEQDLPALQRDTSDIRLQLAREQSKVASQQEEVAEARAASQRYERILQDLAARATDEKLAPRASNGDANVYAQQIVFLRRELADAYEFLGAGPGDALSEEELAALRQKHDEAQSENSMLKTMAEDSAQGTPVASGYQAAEARVELISRLARQRTEIADLRERLRREELRGNVPPVAGGFRQDSSTPGTPRDR